MRRGVEPAVEILARGLTRVEKAATASPPGEPGFES
jgi:hypothetical protein